MSVIVVTPTSIEDNIEFHVLFEDQVFTFVMPGTTTCRQLLNQAKHELYPGRVEEERRVNDRCMN